ncbi:MAG: Mov34/MPN/PAD-1 family protein [Nitrospinae bacterium]|nr:Mov34/MPN/PAD-1 family protein [Nitrospinota bacterium]
MTRVGPDDAVRRALTLISEHPGVHQVDAPLIDEASGATTVNVTFGINLPNEWRRQGESPSGVRLKEVVRLDFPSGFPLEPPELSLRTDFTRDLPHMQPWVIDGRPVPCIYDGDLAELLHTEGLAGILNQTFIWLENAALGTLIDPEQGWEPVRRDSLSDVVVADAEHLQGLVDRHGGHRFLKTNYLKIDAADGTQCVNCQVLNEVVKVDRVSVVKVIGESKLNDDVQFRRGASLALVVWPGKHPSGETIVCDTYFPETVDSVNSLKERAALYGCKQELGAALSLLGKCLVGRSVAAPFTIVVILLARRPYKVIGSVSPIEVCPYVIDVQAPHLFTYGGVSAVRAAAHRHAISRTLLAQMAGNEATAERPCWTLLGAGSLGSKLALHLARAGNGPDVVVDKSRMKPHNAARHALIPATGDMQFLWMDTKVRALSKALSGFNQTTTPIVADAALMAVNRSDAQGAWSSKTWAVVNATASLAVREALGASESLSARVIETSLFSEGRIGVITVEGLSRNPITTDLMAEFYAILHENPHLASIVFNDDDPFSRQIIGHGCGSLTTVMSDSRLSLFAAGMAEYLLAKQREGMPDEGGEVMIGRLTDDGLGLEWRACPTPRVTVVQTNNGEAWCVHLHERALTKMQEEVARWPNVETGGVLMGRLSEVSRVAHVVDVLDAPEDSRRTANEFVLGTKGLRNLIRTYSEAVGWSLYCLGTWHSHLSPSGPSPTDRDTARAVSLARLTPSIFVIMTPAGFEALTGDATDFHLQNMHTDVEVDRNQDA